LSGNPVKRALPAALVPTSVSDLDADFGIIDRRTGGIIDREIDGAGADSGVDDGDSFRIDRCCVLRSQGWHRK
jgi:hypothetical protein